MGKGEGNETFTGWFMVYYHFGMFNILQLNGLYTEKANIATYIGL